MANLRFDIYQGEQLVRTERLNQLPVKVGQLPTNQLRLDGPDVARMHAVIEEAAGGGLQIVDLGTPGGTFVNGAKVQENHPLNSGDKVTIGGFSVSVTDEGAQASAPQFGGAPAGGFGGAPQFGGAPAGGFGGAPTGGGFGGASPPWSAPSAPAADPGAEAAAKAEAEALRETRRRRRNALEFERRFLSETYNGGKGALEVAMLWKGNLLRIDQYKNDGKSDITIGKGEAAADGDKVQELGVTYGVDVEGMKPSQPFITEKGERWSLHLNASMMDGFLLVDPSRNGGDPKVPVSEAEARGFSPGGQVDIDGNTRARIEIGDVAFLIHFVSTPALALVGRSRIAAVSRNSGIGAVFLLVMIILLMEYTPKPGNPTAEEALFQAEAMAAMLEEEEEEEEEEPEEEEEEPEEEEEIAEEMPEEPAAGQPRAAGEEGTAGEPDNNNGGRMSVAGSGGALSLAQRQNVASSGLLAASGSMSALQGLGAVATGSDAMNAWGSFDGSLAPGGGAGNFGLGTSGAGMGGGGTGMGAIGGGGEGGDALGSGHNTEGRGRGTGTGGRRPTREPVLRPARANVNGALDPAIIRRVVNRHKREVLNCYQRELMKDPSLEGRVEMRWVIDGTGNVGSVSVNSTTLRNSAVESCIAGRIRRWRFPRPTNGGRVAVKYPFNFTSQ